MIHSNYLFSQYSFIYLACGLLALFLAAQLLSQRIASETKFSGFLSLAIAIWSLANVMESGAKTIELKQYWSAVSYIGTAFTPYFFLLLSAHYTGRLNILKSRNLIFLSIIPIFFIFIAATNVRHHLLWPTVILNPATNLGNYGHGSIFWIFIIYSYLLLASGIAILVSFSIKQYKLFTKQAVILIIGSIIPMIGNLLYVFKILPPVGFDWTPTTFLISAFLLTIGIRKFRLFDVVPVARGQLIQRMNIGYIVTDPKGVIQDYNPVVLKILSLKPDQILIGEVLSDCVTDCDTLLESIKNIRSTDSEIHTEFQLNRNFIESWISPISTSKGNISGILIMLQDINARMETDKIKEEHIHRLDQEMIEKEKLIQELDAYAHTVAHDLKNPISSVIGFLELIGEEIRDIKSDDLIKFHQYASKSSEYLLHIIDELLLMATIRKGHIEASDMDMQNIIKRVLFRLDHLIRQTEAIIKLPESWPVARGYSAWIEEVWANYMSNAIKYGGTPPEIELGWDHTESGLCRFWVKDNGKGVSAELQKQLFVPSPELIHDKKSSHGLGLSIVKRIMDRLGGTVGHQNLQTNGGGSLFFFTLPYKKQAPGF